jgi:nucleoside-diphosphate-sugar epimerase
VARVLIVGCGCRGRALARELRREGHAIRGTTRYEHGRAAIEETGAESYVGDPDRVGTLTYALDGATVLCWLLGSARGSPESLAALHGTRLQMLLERATDTTVRGVVYETAGTVDPAVLEGGVEALARARATSEIPFALVDQDPGDHEAWLASARGAVASLLVAQ